MTIALNSALTGLKAAQRALDTISSNIANAQTVGYTRKILPQETQVIGGVTVGVETNSLIRNVDKYLMRDIYKQTSVSSNVSTQQQFLSQIQDFHGASDAGRSLSASVGNLQASFTELSTSPDSQLLLNKTLAQAQATADKFNALYTLYNSMRTQAEDDIASSVNAANEQIRMIASLNEKINREGSAGQSTADLEDKRDMAVKELSKYLEISSFPSENGKIVVMTKQGQTLADETAHELVFPKNQISSASYYPGGGLDGLYISNPSSNIIVNQSAIGGKLGALFTIRDETVPTYQAQADELAQKMAERFDQAGLRLFTDTNGSVPASTTPPAPTGYVGFAGRIRVNTDIINDPTLLRSGTTGHTVLQGSNEVISKIVEYTFGASAFQRATGTVDISAGDIFTAAGLSQTNKVIGNMDLTDYDPDLSAAPGVTVPATFDLTINGTPYTVTINAGDTATDLVNNINALTGQPTASLNGLGQMVFTSDADITIADNTIGSAGMASLGFSFGTTLAKNPSFSVQVGGQSPVTVTIAPGDTSTNLLATLNAIPGLSASLNPSGQLVLQPTEGGSITIANVSGTPMQALGLNITNVPHAGFRSASAGPSGGLSTNLLGSSRLTDYATSMISTQSEDASAINDRVDKEATYLSTLETRNSNQSGVDIDQELSELIRIQTAYSAAGRMVSASEQMMDELFNAFFR